MSAVWLGGSTGPKPSGAELVRALRTPPWVAAWRTLTNRRRRGDAR